MKTLNILVLFLLVFGLVFSVPTLAREYGAGKSAMMGEKGESGAFHGFKASELTGKELRSAQGEKLGKIEDVVISREGQVNFVVLSQAGAEDRLTPIPFMAIVGTPREAGAEHLIADLSKDKLASAPTFSKNDWPNLTGSDWEDRVYGYYGMERHDMDMGVRGEDSLLEKKTPGEMEHR